MFLSDYQVNFTQTLKKPQKVKRELAALTSAEVGADENETVRYKSFGHLNLLFLLQNQEQNNVSVVPSVRVALAQIFQPWLWY